MLSQTSEQQITTIPFFVSSGSTHLADIRFALGLSEDSLLDTKLSQIFPKSQIIWGKAMDSHPFILEYNRIKALSLVPDEEGFLLVAHGSDKPDYEAI